MKKQLLILLCLLTATFFRTAPLYAQVDEGEQRAAASAPSADTTPFTIIIMGTRNFGEVDQVRKNLSRLSTVRLIVPLMESQQHVELFGAMTSTADQLLADIRSLSADRYNVESRNDRERGLIVTLKKLGQ